MTSLSATVRQHSTFQSLIRHQKSTNKPKQIYKIPYNSLDILLWLLEYLRIFSMLYTYFFICKFGRLKLAMNKKKNKGKQNVYKIILSTNLPSADAQIRCFPITFKRWKAWSTPLCIGKTGLKNGIYCCTLFDSIKQVLDKISFGYYIALYDSPFVDWGRKWSGSLQFVYIINKSIRTAPPKPNSM